MSLENIKGRIKADIERNRKRIKELGPGVITGGAGDDPAGIVTYTLVGASTGLSQLWLLLLSTPMMIAVQNSVARIAIVTGKSLPELITAFYSKKLTYFTVLLLSVANILTIGADLDALASILGIVFNLNSLYFLIPITALIAYLVIYHSYKTVKRVLVSLTLLLGVYILNVIVAKPDLKDLLFNTFVPHIELHKAWIMAALGLLGTTISPYMLFWQAAEEREEHKSVVQAKSVSADTILGMTYSNILAYCMIVSGAIVLHGQGVQQDIQSIAQALEPLTSRYAFALFSIGIVVSGLLAIPVLAGSTAYAVADAFGWREGMDNKVSDAKGFYMVFLGSMLIGDFIDLSSISVVDALYYSQVLDGLLLPFLILLIMLLSNNKAIMGPHTNGPFNNLFSLFTLIVTLALTVTMFL